MNFDEYVQRFRVHRSIAEVRDAATLVEGDVSYPLLEATVPGRRTLLVTAGFHGNEVAGPLTLVERLPEIVAYARARDVGLRIFPCLNPSGFHDGTRYNRSGEAPNNDMIRYQIAPDRWIDHVPAGQTFLQWVPYAGGPKETRALLAALEQHEAPAAALDLHQDPWLEGVLAYAYIFGANGPYLPLVEATQALVPIARDTQVDDNVRTERHGLIQLHDGSVTDYMFRRNVPFTAALETTTATPMPLAHDVNMVWIRGFVNFVALR